MAGKILIGGSVVRALYGTLALFLPKLLLASVGMSEEEVGNEARYFNRLLGGRDLLVALGTVLAVKAGSDANAVKTNLFCEATDSIALGAEIRARGKLERTTIIGAAFNIVGYFTWLRALSALSGPSDAGE
jgi:hypothetical protein